MLNAKKSSLTIFFMLLTLSIGLVSVNLPLTVKAQNNALSQTGNGDSEQETKLGQSFEQDSQIVSGKSSILSGNNIGCQNQDNSKAELSQCQDIGDLIPSDNTVPLLAITTVLRANCENTPCPTPDGLVQIFIDDQLWLQYEAKSGEKEGMTYKTFRLPEGTSYSIHGVGSKSKLNFDYEGANIQGDCSGKDTCNAIMGPNGARVTVNFHYACTYPIIFC